MQCNKIIAIQDAMGIRYEAYFTGDITEKGPGKCPYTLGKDYKIYERVRFIPIKCVNGDIKIE